MVIGALQNDPLTLRFIANPLVIAGSIETIGTYIAAAEDLAAFKYINQSGGWAAKTKLR